MSNPWGKVGSWADDSEAAAAATEPSALPEEAFPTLGEAKKTGKKKKQTVSLSEFNSGKYVGPGGKRSNMFSDNEGLTSDEMLLLPTGPKERTEEEIRESLPGGRLGGGFRDYGRDREGRDYGRRGDRDRDRERGYSFDREDASRADESSDWSSNKPARGERHGDRRHGGFEDDRRFGGDRDMPSKADEVDNWNMGKKFVPTERKDDFGRGFGKADADDNWGVNKRPVTSERWSFRRSDDGPGPDGDRWGRRSEDPPAEDKWSPGARRERPRLNLQPRTLPVDSSTLPSSNHSSRPGTPEEAVEVKPRKKVDPFGNAKPREVLLEERGQDWRKIDMMLESKRAEHQEEKKLKNEISSLKEAFDATGEPAIKEQIAEKEQELEELSKELDSKARVSDSWRKDAPARKEDPSARKEEPVKKPAPAENAWKKPASEENAWKKPATEENAWKKPATEENAWKKPATEENAWKKPATEENAWKKPAAEENAWKKSSAEENAWKKSSTEENAWKKPATEENAWKKPATEENAWKKPATEENAWKKGGNPWKRENGRDRANVDRW